MTVVTGSLVKAEQGVGLDRINLASDILDQSSSWHGGRCSVDRAAASGGICRGSTGSWRQWWFVMVRVATW